MCSFISKYSRKAQSEWKPLFYKILQNKIRDLYRKRSIRSRWQALTGVTSDEDNTDLLEKLEDKKGLNPEQETQNMQAIERLQIELKLLSLKQQQVFLLRAWEGLSISETALAMGCSEGAIKSHYSRATERLRKKLGKYWL
jgi:RNA polymerase sigma-70 factor (ECF subfamily)